LTGTDIISGSTVEWNGSSLTTTYVSPWQITAVITAAEFATRPSTLTVMNPSGTSAGFNLR
jgi:hypothetical protein